MLRRGWLVWTFSMVCSWLVRIYPAQSLPICPSALRRASQDGMDGHTETRGQVKQGLKTLWGFDSSSRQHSAPREKSPARPDSRSAKVVLSFTSTHATS
jgi:hypothetical protein